MRFIIVLALLLPNFLQAQPPKMKNKKYQGLLWEISGNGMKKPSYLFGTMHVSNKVAFHLADSFYLGIRNADVVALETNPETWQEDMDRYNRAMVAAEKSSHSNREGGTSDFFRQGTLRFFKYDRKIESALVSTPSMINSLLYRSYSGPGSDFEEDTYLDLYIFQCGKRWGKKVAGVEDYEESTLLVAEAYRDAANDKSRRQVPYDRDGGFSNDRLQESYRTGNLDWLDSINRYNSTSAAFDEKFLYKRNEIQARNIDSILRSGNTLFVGVGAAHLPGDRGVIEMLRAMGYQLRPVFMGTRDSEHKALVEKLRVPVSFSKWQSEDGIVQVDLPGKFYEVGEDYAFKQMQYADMANGSYYMMTRFLTDAWLWDHTPEQTLKVVDSMLYENIPGRILSKKEITVNGYPGFDIVNRTRRGDVQRYQIIATPFEMFVFKLSGTGDYITGGDEAERFFSSIRIKNENSGNWVNYTPPVGGFSVMLPQSPFVGNDGSWLFDAIDSKTNIQYRIIHTDINNLYFAEVDSFDLGLMEESFASSEFIDKRTSRKNLLANGYPSLEAIYKDKAGKYLRVQFIIQGPHYYTLIARSAKQVAANDKFFRTFRFTDFQYGPSVPRVDTALHYTVSSPVFPALDSNIAGMPIIRLSEQERNKDVDPGAGQFRTRILASDSTGERIYLAYTKANPYLSKKRLDEYNAAGPWLGMDTSWIIRKQKEYIDPRGFQINEWQVSDTGSSRVLWFKRWLRGDIEYLLATQTDSLTKPSRFLTDVFSSFTPADSVGKVDVASNKIDLFLSHFHSGDSTARRRAINGTHRIELDSSHLSTWKAALGSLNFKEKDYLLVKKRFITKLSEIKTREASDFLVDLFHAAGDTLELQNTALETLLRQKTRYSFEKFRQLLADEPPIIEVENSDRVINTSLMKILMGGVDFSRPESFSSSANESFFDELRDTMELTREILPDILPLLNVHEYKKPIMRLLGELIDSNIIKPSDYESYYSKFLLEARLEYRKQMANARQRSIEEARKEEDGGNIWSSIYNKRQEADAGDIPEYLRLLLPFWDQKPSVQGFVNQMLQNPEPGIRLPVVSILLDAKKPVHDSLINALAKEEKYRFYLYNALYSQNQVNRFPAKYSTQQELAKSLLKALPSYTEIDSLVYIDRLPATEDDRKGFVYFFKYTTEKNSNNWKIATVGLVPTEPSKFYWDKFDSKRFINPFLDSGNGWTEVSDKRLLEDEPIRPQLEKQLRRLQVEQSKSGKRFYGNAYSEYDYY